MHAYLFFLARRGAKRRAARFISSSRAKRACIPRASQGQRDFLLAVTVNRLIGCPQSVGKILRMSILQMV